MFNTHKSIMKDNYNIKVNPPKLSSEDIGKHKNFDALLEQFNQGAGASETVGNAGRSSGSQFLVKYVIGGSLAIAASIALVLIFRGMFDSGSDTKGTLALNSPFDKIQKGFAQFQVDADKGDTLKHSSGSVIVVPATAFVDKTGKPVSGKVDIQYREFDDPIDMFLAGVPQSDKHQSLQTAGLMQIQGFKDGEPIFISKDKELQLELKSTVPASLPLDDLKVYAYTAGESDWKQGGNVKVEVLDNIGGLESPKDSAGIKLTNNTDSKEAVLAKLEQKYPAPAKPIEPKKGTPKDMVVLGIDLNVKDFPEFAQYGNVEWIAAKTIVSPLPEEGWVNVQVKRISELKYEMVMTPSEEAKKQGRKEVRFEAFPLIPFTQKTKADYDKAMIAYNAALSARKETLNSEIAAWEKGEGRFAETPANQDNKGDASALKQIVSRFAVAQFGLWNAANRFDLNQLATVQPDFVDAEGKKINVSEVFVADMKRHLYYSAAANSKLHYDVSNDNAQLWVMNEKGELLVAAPAPKEEGANIRFVLQPATIQSESDLRKALTI